MKKRVGKFSIEITHPDKLFFNGITKLDIINYYEKISEYMIPLIKDKPVMMQRSPDGIFGSFFYQKDASDYFPKWINTVDIAKKDGTTQFVLCNNKAALLYLANQACLTFHTWLSRSDKLNFPDKMVFDLDPSDKDFSKVIKVAKLLKELLVSMGINPFIMTTGSKGLHIVVPLKRYTNFEKVKHFADYCANILSQQYPEFVTLQLRKEKRGNAVFLDTLRNMWGSTAVAPFSVRLYDFAPIATPIYWSDLDSKNFNSQKYNIGNIFNYLKKVSNPWSDFYKHAISLRSIKI